MNKFKIGDKVKLTKEITERYTIKVIKANYKVTGIISSGVVRLDKGYWKNSTFNYVSNDFIELVKPIKKLKFSDLIEV